MTGGTASDSPPAWIVSGLRDLVREITGKDPAFDIDERIDDYMTPQCGGDGMDEVELLDKIEEYFRIELAVHEWERFTQGKLTGPEWERHDVSGFTFVALARVIQTRCQSPFR